MKAKAKIRSWQGVWLFAALVLLVCVFKPSDAAAQAACYLNNPFGNYWGIHGIGHERGGGSRRHKGADVMICQDVAVPLPSIAGPDGVAQTCKIIPNGNDPLQSGQCGYGFWMRFDCGNNIEVRYAHLNGYNGNTQTAINGRTGASWTTASHVHWEIYIDNHAVDPTCAVGMERDKIPCRASIPGSGVNVCDPAMRNLLKEDAKDKLQRNVHSYTSGASTSPMTQTPYRPGEPADRWNGQNYGDPCQLQCGSGPPQCRAPNPQDPKTCPEGEAEQGEHEHPELPPTPWDWDTEPPGPGTGPIDNPERPPGERGGIITPGRDRPPARIPPIDESDGGEPTSCALDTMVAMTNQSALEARRETAMQRRFIAKADSVIEFGCLAKYLKDTQGEHVAGIFSETDEWVNYRVPIGMPYPPGTNRYHHMTKTLGVLSMDSSILNVIWAAHESYKQNFAHPLMGGLEGYSETVNGEACADMQKVWDAARCQNFPAPTEAFPRFTDLIGEGKDPRKFPSTLACNNTGINQGMIDAAKNKATRFDKVDPKFNYVAPPTEECADPIPTGVRVHRPGNETGGESGFVSNIEVYDDAICPNPGCTYRNENMSGMGECIKS